MELRQANIAVYDSLTYGKYYDITKNLVNIFPKCNWFCVPTTLKGIGKSYSVWHTRIIPDINKLKKGTIIIRWSKDELDLLVFNLRSNPEELENHLNINLSWSKFKGMHVASDIETGMPYLYFVTPTQFKIIKGMTIAGDLPLRNIYWDEFLLPDGIYKKPKQVIDSFWQLIGSTFRDKEYYIFMISNNTDPNNPFLWYLFDEMGWPEYGQIIVNQDAGVVIDSPLFNDYLKRKYRGTTYERNAKLNDQIYKQLFGEGKLNDSIYGNQELIMYNLAFESKFKFSVQLGIDKFAFYSFYNSLDQAWMLYVFPYKGKEKCFYAGNEKTEFETGLKKIDDYMIKMLRSFMKNVKIRFRDGRTQNTIISWIESFRDTTKIIDWSKGKEV